MSLHTCTRARFAFCGDYIICPLFICVTYSPLFFGFASLALEQSYYCPVASEITLTDVVKTATKHNKARTVNIFLGMHYVLSPSSGPRRVYSDPTRQYKHWICTCQEHRRGTLRHLPIPPEEDWLQTYPCVSCQQ